MAQIIQGIEEEAKHGVEEASQREINLARRLETSPTTLKVTSSPSPKVKPSTMHTTRMTGAVMRAIFRLLFGSTLNCLQISLD